MTAFRLSIALLVLFAACSGNVVVVRTDVGADTSVDTTVDAGSDVSTDARSETSTDGQSCADLQSAATSAYNTVLAANQACTSDYDCVFGDLACFYACGPPASNTTGVGTVNATAIQLCQQLTAEGCPLVHPEIFCPASRVACVAGTCTSSIGTLGGCTDAGSDAETCDSVQCEGSAEIASALSALLSNEWCSVDSDCTIADTACFPMCSPIVSTSGASQVSSTASDFCARLTGLGCPAMVAPPCANPGTSVACEAGTCVWVNILP